jgi:hypothetical protein
MLTTGVPRFIKIQKRPKSRLARDKLRGKAKAQQRARAQALAKAKLDPNYVEPVLGPNLFSESESEAESSQPMVVPYPKLWFWNDGAKDENLTVESDVHFIVRNSNWNVVDI